MAVWTVLAELINPVVNVIDELHTSEEERLQIKAALFQIQAEMASKMMDYESRLVEAKMQIITAEAKGSSWLQNSWRPITMITFLALVVADTFGLTAFRLAEDAWSLLQIGLGGYVVGRSVEKIVPQVTKVMSKDD